MAINLKFTISASLTERVPFLESDYMEASKNKVKRITFTISDQEVKDEKNWQIGDHQSSECYLYKKETIA